MSSLDSIKEKTETAVSFLEWLAEVLRGRNWVTKLLLLDVVLFTFLNPVSLRTLLELFPTESKPPDWYTWAFWPVIGLIFGAALVVVYRTAPRKDETVTVPDEYKAIKGLRPFRFEDAEVFARLQRETSLRECLATVTDGDFRFSVLCGESGCGKTSFLQAGLWPRLLKQNHQCIYVKFAELDPLDSVRQALAEKSQFPPERLAGADFPPLLATVAPAGSPPLVLLFDQFEQFFVHRQRKEEREPFVQALAEWFKNKQPPQVKILLCLREDFYGRLIELQKAMGYSLGPEQSLHLEKFTPKEAAAIFGVIAETEHLPGDEDFVQKLTERELAGREDGLISAVDLQILAWIIRGQRSAEERAFNRAAFQKLGGLEGLLERFLSRALKVRETEARRQAALKVLLALTDLERNARAGVLSAEEVEKELHGTVSRAEVREALEWLARGDVRLATPIERGATRGYELAHERLIPALRRLAGKELSAADQANQLLDRRVNEWLGNNHARRYLLTWREWRLIQRQKPFLVRGTNQNQKEALIVQTERYWHWVVGAVSLLVMLPACYFVWLYSPWGQISQVRSDIERLSGRITNWKALKELAIALSKDGNYGQARQVWERIDDSFTKYQTLFIITRVSEKIGDPTKAKEFWEDVRQLKDFDIIRTAPLPDPRSLIAAVEATAKIKGPAYAADLVEQGRRVSISGTDPDSSRAQQLANLAEAAVTIGHDKKVTVLLDRICESAERINDPKDKATALANIAEAAAKIGEPARVAALMEQAVQTADEIMEPEDKATVFVDIAERAPTISGLGKATSLLNQALQAAERINNPKDKATALANIAEAAAKIGEPARVAALMEQAVQTAEWIDDPKDKATALVRIAETAEKGNDLSKAAKLLEQAQRTAEGIGNSEPSSVLSIDEWTGLFTALAKLDQAKIYPSLLELVSRKTEGLRQLSKAWVLVAIAHAKARISVEKNDHLLLEQAHQLAEEVVDPEAKARVVSHIIQASAKFGDTSKAASLLSWARQMAESMESYHYNAEIMTNLARSYASLGQWGQAREVAKQNTTDDSQAKALAVVLEVWAERRNPALAEVGEDGE